jgi:hypothetical protein
MWQRVLRCFRRHPIIMDVLAGLAFALDVTSRRHAEDQTTRAPPIPFAGCSAA